jgi:RNA polymerase sigma factor (TIGR02999 family)
MARLAGTKIASLSSTFSPCLESKAAVMTSAGQVTQLLKSWSQGDQRAFEQLTPLVYGELRRLARGRMARERPDHTLQVTALVHEAYLRLVDAGAVDWQDRAHFFAISAQMMRRILVDAARARHYQKREGAACKVPLEEGLIVSSEPGPEFVALDDALNSLAALDPRKSQIVELRFFGGLTVEETAEALQLSPRSVMREWSLAQAWLYRELSKGQSLVVELIKALPTFGSHIRP